MTAFMESCSVSLKRHLHLFIIGQVVFTQVSALIRPNNLLLNGGEVKVMSLVAGKSITGVMNKVLGDK